MIRRSRLGLVHAALLVFAMMLVVRAAQVQLWEGRAWSARAERQHFQSVDLPPPRGEILDSRGTPLARDRELVRLHLAPREVRDAAALRRQLSRASVSEAWLARHLGAGRKAWVTVPGTHLPSDVAPALAMQGVYGEKVSERVYALPEGARQVVGRASGGTGADGIELALDALLRGTRGRATMLRDAGGRRFESPTAPGESPARPGHTVVLTLSNALQDIADRALTEAVARTGSDGGDIVVLDPHDGAVLALASRRSGRSSQVATAITEPFEPGSTLKPFFAAALLAAGRARPEERIETFDGTITLHGRTIHDTRRAPDMSLREIIEWSSNVGIVRFAERLSAREQYELLRDLGFGAPTGVPYPSEASGTLREPRRWSAQSAASLAMGYEIAVTPLQLATAYASIANGGELLEPALVREIRAPDGTVRFRHRRRVVRRVMEPAIAREMRDMLEGAVARGTAVQAELSTFAVGGKTGTARQWVRGGYGRQRYVASYVGLFPIESPQYVVLVKLDNPRGEYYGGQTAAPVSKAVLEAALAARDAALDRGALRAGQMRAAARRSGTDAGESLSQGQAPPAAGQAAYLYHLTTAPADSPPAVSARAVPDVRGLPLRDAVHALHRSGFRVRLARGASGVTAPAPGSLASTGSVIDLQWEQR